MGGDSGLEFDQCRPGQPGPVGGDVQTHRLLGPAGIGLRLGDHEVASGAHRDDRGERSRGAAPFDRPPGQRLGIGGGPAHAEPDPHPMVPLRELFEQRHDGPVAGVLGQHPARADQYIARRTDREQAAGQCADIGGEPVVGFG